MIAFFMFVFTSLFAEKILFMEPVSKNVDKKDKDSITENLQKIYSKKYNSVIFTDIDSDKMESFKKCGSKPECWSEKGEDAGFDYASVFLIKEEKGGIVIKTIVIDVIEEKNIAEESASFDSASDADIKSLYKLVQKSLSKISSRIVSDGSVKKEAASKKKEADLEAKREKAKKLEAMRAKEKEKEDEARLEQEKEKLDIEKREREREKKDKSESNKKNLEGNASKLKKAREKILDMCKNGNYNDAIKGVVSLTKVKCECEEDAKGLALKTQLLNFNNIRSKIIEGIDVLNFSLILDNLEAAKALDEEIVPGGTDFSKKIDKIYAIGFYAKAVAMEKKENYTLADESYQKCVEKDENKAECKEWLESKDKLVKKLYDKSKIVKDFNPTKAKELLRSVLKLVTAENEYYKKAEAELQTME